MPGKLARLADSMGSVDALLYAAARGLARGSSGHLRLRKYYIVSQPVAAGDLTPPRRGRSIEVSEGTRSDAAAVEFGRPRAVIEQRLASGTRYLVARRNGELLGFQWFSLVDYDEDEVRCRYRLRPADRCAWDFDIFVRPEARTLPVFARLWDACNAILRAQGITRSLSRIDAFNPASRQAHASLGATTVGWCLFVTAGRAQLSVLSARPWLHLSLSGEAAPVLAVSSLPLGRERKHA
jgi:hypothetical protein